MNIQTVKAKVLKAKKTLDFAKSKGLPTRNYVAIAYNDAIEKLEWAEDVDKFQKWYQKQNF